MQQQQPGIVTPSSISSLYGSPDVWLGLELLRDIQFRLPSIVKETNWLATSVTGSGCGNHQKFQLRFFQAVVEPPFRKP